MVASLSKGAHFPRCSDVGSTRVRPLVRGLRYSRHRLPGVALADGADHAAVRGRGDTTGFTCWNVAPQCGEGGRVIHIACPAPFVYQNEAHNSWALIGQRSGIDPYGQGSPAEQASCDRFR